LKASPPEGRASEKVAENFCVPVSGRRGEAPPAEFHLVKFFFLDLWIKFGKIKEKV
jgi:hypothetical protein